MKLQNQPAVEPIWIPKLYGTVHISYTSITITGSVLYGSTERFLRTIGRRKNRVFLGMQWVYPFLSLLIFLHFIYILFTRKQYGPRSDCSNDSSLVSKEKNNSKLS